MKCQEKNAYPSRSMAERAMHKRMRDNRTLELRVYCCPVCGHWHMTSKQDRFSKDDAA